MEDQGNNSNHNRRWDSEGKFKLDWTQSFRDTIQLENRLKILEIEKQCKVKEIEKKLDNHKRNVELKITKFNRHKDVGMIWYKYREHARSRSDECDDVLQSLPT